VKTGIAIVIVLIVLMFQHKSLNAQDIGGNADVFTEEYTDEFQEYFFEALKQYAIENYEKAIIALEECKKLQPDYAVIDFELSKNFLELRQYFKAEDYMLKALEAEPENVWYLEGLFSVYKAQNNTSKAIEVATRLSEKNVKYKENLVRLYMRSGQYVKALKLLDDLDAEYGKTTIRRNQRIRLRAMKNYDEELEEALLKNKLQNTKNTQNPLEALKADIDNLMEEADYNSIEQLTDEALESYPAQAELYYLNALAKNKLKKYKEAIETFEMALEFAIDNTSLENKIYKQMVLAYSALGNTKKSEEYNRKIKKGL
jgi:tetratricopeptide (TPR) repeat protein